MVGEEINDNFSAYAYWRSNIDKYKIFRNFAEESLPELKERINKSHQKEELEKQNTVENTRLFQMWKLVEAADESLREMKLHHNVQQRDFKERWRKISQGREAVELNKKKFRHFIRKTDKYEETSINYFDPYFREKQGKIEDGLDRVDKEKNLQFQKVGELRDLKRNFQINNLAKKSLSQCCKERKIYSDFLSEVVEMKNAPNPAYTDIRSLINRCEALMETRQKLRARLEEMEQSITEEEQIVEKMNEDKMINALNSNVELGCLQTHFDKLAASVMERKTFLENKEREKTRKRLLISRVRLAILTMFQSVCRDAVKLPGDSPEVRRKGETVDEMMELIKNHIGDLVIVNSRVQGSEKAEGYNMGLVSLKSGF